MCKVDLVKFYEDELLLAQKGNVPYVPVRPICENLGIAWQSQHRKLLQEAQRWGVENLSLIAQDGKKRQMPSTPLFRLPAW